MKKKTWNQIDDQIIQKFSNDVIVNHVDIFFTKLFITR